MLPLVLVEGGLERVELSCIMRGYNTSYGTTPNTTLGPGGFQVDAYAARSLQRCTLRR